jgi:hypothetical protein
LSSPPLADIAAAADAIASRLILAGQESAAQNRRYSQNREEFSRNQRPAYSRGVPASCQVESRGLDDRQIFEAPALFSPADELVRGYRKVRIV